MAVRCAVEALELLPGSSASFTGWMVVMFTEERTMAGEVVRGKEGAEEVCG